MVVTPVVRGLLGIETLEAGATLRVAPALPASWDRASASGVRAGGGRDDVTIERASGRTIVRVARRDSSAGRPRRLIAAPALPLDAKIRGVTVNGSAVKHEATLVGDVQRVQVMVDDPPPMTEIVFTYAEGTDVYVDVPDLRQGAASEGLRILRARADRRALRLILEGRGNRTYVVGVRTPRRLGAAEGVVVVPAAGRDQQLRIRFGGAPDAYVRRDIIVPFVQR
jgi:hypothetical protein